MALYLGEKKSKRPFGGLIKGILLIPVIAISILIAFWWQDYRNEDTGGIDAEALKSTSAQLDKSLQALNSIKAIKTAQIGFLNKLMATGIRIVDSDTLALAIPHLLASNGFNLAEIGSLGIQSLSQSSNNLKASFDYYWQSEVSDENFVLNELEPYLVNKQVLSLLEPYDDSEFIDISDQQINRIIRLLLNDRSFVDLVYLRIQRLTESQNRLMALEEAIESHLSAIRTFSQKTSE
ncbi:MAG: hypothetical protein COW03_07100 [Cytophagales bacterium CG12_big_fil_rev_8_21_14_0_65_40_12]|nr:MAG: hypothetical protein COW03_07100 [Cytophagales bacterium CG12_big_fil_rev_8_21_14_0_65_40_12]PIW02877.1 MAG: hypothetical protein COW40_18020 [Cytophagales bacterium CG17_big_fil_post_rev_8_21_14_2_50_40_13]